MYVKRSYRRTNREPFEEVPVATGGIIGKTILGMMATLAVSGIITLFSLNTKVAQLSESVTSTEASVARTEASVTRTLDHAVDREEYLRRDAQIQKAIDMMATKEELTNLKTSMDQQSQMLHDIAMSLNTSNARSVRTTR